MTISRIANTPYDLQTWDGDSGTITIKGLPADSDDYVLFMEIHGSVDVVKEIPLNGESEISIELTVADTESLGAGQWTYGVKLCKDGKENTLIPNLKIGPRALFIVNHKVVEGEDDE